MGILLFIIIRNSFDWESTSNIDLNANTLQKKPDPKKPESQIIDSPAEVNLDLQRPKQSTFNYTNLTNLRDGERDTLFRYTYMYPAPDQDFSRPTTSKKSKFHSEYIRVVWIHFFLLVLPVLADLGFLIVFNLKNDAQYFEHLSLIFGKNKFLNQYFMKILLILLRWFLFF